MCCTSGKKSEGPAVVLTNEAVVSQNVGTFSPFLSDGQVSLTNVEHSLQPIKILRDTGASVSLVLQDVLPFSDDSYSGRDVQVKGVENGVLNVPLHSVHLESDLLSGDFVLGVRPNLPVEGVSVILGNDLCGGRVTPDPTVTKIPCAASRPVQKVNKVKGKIMHASKKHVINKDVLKRHGAQNTSMFVENNNSSTFASAPTSVPKKELTGVRMRYRGGSSLPTRRKAYCGASPWCCQGIQ